MKKIIILTALTLISITNIFAQTKNDQARAYYIEAEKNYELNNYQSSLNNLNKVEEILGATNARVLALKVKSSYGAEDYINAKKYLNKFSNYDSSEALKNEILSYIVKIDNKIEEAKLEAERKKELDERNWLKATSNHIIQSYETYLNNSKNTLYRSEAKRILTEDEGFKEIRLAKKQLATPKGLTDFYFKNKSYSSPKDFELSKSTGMLKLGKNESYREGPAYEVHEIYLAQLNKVKINIKKGSYYDITFYGEIDRTIYKRKKRGLVFDFKRRLTHHTEKYYSPSIDFKNEKSLEQFLEAFKKYLNNSGYYPSFVKG